MAYFREAVRQFRHRPGVSLAIVGTLSIAIGANALVFSGVRGVLLKPLPFPEAGRLVTIWETQPGNDTRGVAPANFLDWRRAASFDGLAAYNRRVRSLGAESPERVTIATVSSNFFGVLGVQALAGRTFTSAAALDTTREVVLHEGLWRGHFAADPAVIGQTIQFGEGTFVVAGVIAGEQAFPEDVIAWTQAAHDIPELGSRGPSDLRDMRDSRYFRVVGRLKAGAAREQAQAEMNIIGTQLAQAYPATNRDAGIRVVNLQEQLTGSTAPMFWMLFGVVAFMLAIACANVATLLLAAAMGRGREIAIRTALGASRARLLKQLAADSLLLSLAGGGIGLGAAWLVRPALVTLLPAGTPRTAQIEIDLPVAGFTIALSVITSLIFGLAPALLTARAGFTSLRDGGRSGPSLRSARVASLLVAGQLAAALVLVTGTGLMLRAIWTIYQRDVGIDVEGVLALDVSLPDARSRGRVAAALDFTAMAESLAALPGVTSAGAVQALPLSGVGASAALRVEDRAFGPNEAPDVAWRAITPEYFETVGARIVRGRGFSPSDGEGTLPVTIVNEALAKLLWPDRDPIGARVGTGLDGPSGATVTIIGIVADIPQENLRAPVRPEMYRPLTQPSRFSTDAMSLVLRTDGDPAPLTAAARAIIHQVHPRASIGAVRTMSELAAAGVAREISVMRALGIFGGLALLLASVGLNGVMARLVADRRRELGVRIALGASPFHVRWLVLGRTLKLALAAFGAGAAASVVLSRQLGALMHGVSGADPLVFAGSAAILFGTALVASYLPARQASSIDPLSVMKAD